MPEPFLAEIKMISFNFAPQGWAFCNGQLLPINQNQALFALMGTTYGGNGQTNFALPDLRGKVPVHTGMDLTWGQTTGQQSHTLTLSEMPAHTHLINAVAPPHSGTNTNNPSGNFLSNSSPGEIYNSGGGSPPNAPLAAGAISNTGGSQAHTNMQPFLTINFIIALQGIFPS